MTAQRPKTVLKGTVKPLKAPREPQPRQIGLGTVKRRTGETAREHEIRSRYGIDLQRLRQESG